MGHGNVYNEISAARSVNDLNHQPPTRCHPLHQNREGQYAVNLNENNRLIFIPISTDGSSLKGVDPSQITRVRILEVVDYHE